jgi:hypothetical protein
MNRADEAVTMRAIAEATKEKDAKIAYLEECVRVRDEKVFTVYDDGRTAAVCRHCGARRDEECSDDCATITHHWKGKMTNSKGIWTSKAPEDSGWYWWRHSALATPLPARVRDTQVGKRVRRHLDYREGFLEHLEGEWFSLPIQVPLDEAEDATRKARRQGKGK